MEAENQREVDPDRDKRLSIRRINSVVTVCLETSTKTDHIDHHRSTYRNSFLWIHLPSKTVEEPNDSTRRLCSGRSRRQWSKVCRRIRPERQRRKTKTPFGRRVVEPHLQCNPSLRGLLQSMGRDVVGCQTNSDVSKTWKLICHQLPFCSWEAWRGRLQLWLDASIRTRALQSALARWCSAHRCGSR